MPVYHVDLYRLSENSDFESIGLDSYLEGEGVCLIEWAERAEKILPDRAIRVRMDVEGSGRRIEITGLRAPI
ncbi:MAG TPA: tRNA (adenosine(37)-N6)-threonylcarbamoyltransferase complex ATPase subunit type 1 TsaE [bacterium]|nr:tRNA (adenosine(37)-N6)-threonylcarbamoyltransferase complex ATPase subunit type 1 TsaE [bacterium]